MNLNTALDSHLVQVHFRSPRSILPCCIIVILFLQAVTRITERDGVSPEDALRRLQSQWPNSRQVEHANVVLSTLWEPKVTRKQVSSPTVWFKGKVPEVVMSSRRVFSH